MPGAFWADFGSALPSPDPIPKLTCTSCCAAPRPAWCPYWLERLALHQPVREAQAGSIKPVSRKLEKQVFCPHGAWIPWRAVMLGE